MSRIHLAVNFADGSQEFLVSEADPLDDNIPTPAPRPAKGWFLYNGDGQRACRLKDDLHNPTTGYQSRTLYNRSGLKLTGMTYPWWSLIDGNVAEYKTVTRLDRNRAWCKCWEYFLGRTNWVWICQPRNGEMDTNAENTNPDIDPLKLQSIDYANNLRRVISHPGLAPRWTRVDVLKFDNPPASIDGIWKIYLNGEWIELSWENTPQYFLSRTLAGHTDEKLSYGPVVDKGYPGGTGNVKHPAVMSYDAILPTSGLDFYQLPFSTRIYRDSLIAEGVVNPEPHGGIDVMIDALCFSGNITYGRVTQYQTAFDGFLSHMPIVGRFARVLSEDWYELDEMLVRGSLEDRSLYGTWRDRRVYSDWILRNIGCGAPDIGWRRP